MLTEQLRGYLLGNGKSGATLCTFTRPRFVS